MVQKTKQKTKKVGQTQKTTSFSPELLAHRLIMCSLLSCHSLAATTAYPLICA